MVRNLLRWVWVVRWYGWCFVGVVGVAGALAWVWPVHWCGQRGLHHP